jgi:hypothetical protein
MARDIGRRQLVGKVLPAAGAAGLLTAALTPGRADAQDTAGVVYAHPVVGAWMTEVTVPGSPRPPEKGIFSYGGDGIISGTDASKVTGFGTWRPTGSRTFTAEYRHFVISDDQITGLVVVTLTGNVPSRDKFTEIGEGKLLDLDGNVVLSHGFNATATRFGHGPAR